MFELLNPADASTECQLLNPDTLVPIPLAIINLELLEIKWQRLPDSNERKEAWMHSKLKVAELECQLLTLFTLYLNQRTNL